MIFSAAEILFRGEKWNSGLEAFLTSFFYFPFLYSWLHLLSLFPSFWPDFPLSLLFNIFSFFINLCTNNSQKLFHLFFFPLFFKHRLQLLDCIIHPCSRVSLTFPSLAIPCPSFPNISECIPLHSPAILCFFSFLWFFLSFHFPLFFPLILIIFR